MRLEDRWAFRICSVSANRHTKARSESYTAVTSTMHALRHALSCHALSMPCPCPATLCPCSSWSATEASMGKGSLGRLPQKKTPGTATIVIIIIVLNLPFASFGRAVEHKDLLRHAHRTCFPLLSPLPPPSFLSHSPHSAPFHLYRHGKPRAELGNLYNTYIRSHSPRALFCHQ